MSKSMNTMQSIHNTVLDAYNVLTAIVGQAPKFVTVTTGDSDLETGHLTGNVDKGRLSGSVDVQKEMPNCPTEKLIEARDFVKSAYNACCDIANRHGNSVKSVTVDFDATNLEKGVVKGDVELSNGNSRRFTMKTKETGRVEVRVGDNKRTVN